MLATSTRITLANPAGVLKPLCEHLVEHEAVITEQGGTTQFPCPAVGVLQGADHITLVRGAGTDLTDVMAKAEFGRVVSKCEYNTSDSTITVDIAFEGEAVERVVPADKEAVAKRARKTSASGRFRATVRPSPAAGFRADRRARRTKHRR